MTVTTLRRARRDAAALVVVVVADGRRETVLLRLRSDSIRVVVLAFNVIKLFSYVTDDKAQ